jgi:thiamine-monophosphate kinase
LVGDGGARQRAGRAVEGSAKLSEIGEKRLLSDFLLPLVNPTGSRDLAGDDCAYLTIPAGHQLVASTDRVPWDLIGRVAGVMGLRDMGRHLAAINLSDIAATGATPVGLLVTLGLPRNMPVSDLITLYEGIVQETARYGVPILGGDLSEASSPELGATSFGVVPVGQALRRSGAQPGDLVFLSRNPSVGGAALAYFRCFPTAPRPLGEDDEERLSLILSGAHPDFDAAISIGQSGVRATAMDNTDGLGQCLRELAAANGLCVRLDTDLLDVDPLTARVASALNVPVLELILGPGYDFGLVGTLSAPVESLHIVGEMIEGDGVHMSGLRHTGGPLPDGWDYWR